jgi:hypothetical protein
LGEKIQIFDEIIRFLKVNPAPEALDLLPGSFGDGAGFGVYQMVEYTVLQYQHDDVVQSLKKHLTSGYKSVRYWNCQIASLFPSENLIAPLSNLLDENFDMKYFAILALGQIQSLRSKKVLQEYFAKEGNQELKDLIWEFLNPENKP